MIRPVCLSLFDYSGAWATPWTATHRVILVDIQHPPGWHVGSDGIERIGGGVDNALSRALHSAGIHHVDVLLAAPPCTHFTKAGAHLWAQKDTDGRTAADLELVDATLRLVGVLRPRVWALENPPGRLANLKGTGLRQHELGRPRYDFQPCDHGDPWTKRTYLWGRFAAPAQHPVEPEPFPAHLPPGRRDHVTRRSSSWRAFRSLTPCGFARDFHTANARCPVLA